MPYSVIYQTELLYRDLPGLGHRPAIDVLLHHNGRSARAVGILGTGSVQTVFSREIAELLGITSIQRGDKVTLMSLGGRVEVYQFAVELETYTPEFHCRFSGRVGFAEVPLPRNILGLSPIFQQLQIGFRDLKQRVYLLREFAQR